MATRHSSRALRTQTPQRQDTLGKRLRFARISAGLSQDSLAQQITSITNKPISKTAVSRWESGSIGSPLPDNLFAIQAITGFSAHWILTGKGEQKANVAAHKFSVVSPLDRDALRRAIAVALPGENADAHAHVIAGLYDVLLDTPDINDRALGAFATVLSAQRK